MTQQEQRPVANVASGTSIVWGAEGMTISGGKGIIDKRTCKIRVVIWGYETFILILYQISRNLSFRGQREKCVARCVHACKLFTHLHAPAHTSMDVAMRYKPVKRDCRPILVSSDILSIEQYIVLFIYVSVTQEKKILLSIMGSRSAELTVQIANWATCIMFKIFRHNWYI